MTSRSIMKEALSRIAFYSDSEEAREIAQKALVLQQEAFRVEVIQEELDRPFAGVAWSKSHDGPGPSPIRHFY